MATPKVIGGFRVLQELQVGAGSQGTVYKAVCEVAREGIAAVGEVVALKVMAVQDEGQTLWRRLEQRTRELAQLDHPNIVRYKGCFVETGPFADIHVVVQEFLDGETLKDCLAHNPGGLDADRGLEIVKAAIDGLIYTTSRGIVHRDVKPGNIFLCRDGSVKLIDFEIARREGGTATTATGNIRGSFDYMAPDFINATFHGDVQSDIFSMGVVLHEVLTGKTPYQRFNGDRKQANFAFLSRWSNTTTGDSTSATSGGESPIHISSRVKRLLANADDILLKALSPDRAVRYANFSDFRNALRGIRFRDLRNGTTSYRLLQYIGKGGFGEVFKARHRQTGELVAVKHLLKPAYAERFFREAKIMQKLQSLNDSCFVRFIDFFALERASGKDAFLVMAFLDGMPGNSLRDAIHALNVDAGERLSIMDVLIAFRRYAQGLQAMHAKGIFHRDIKPANLYYPAGHPNRAAIMDLGIARDVNGTATTGQVPGTLDYMPPEVVVSDSRGDSGMDIYALGLCLYEALTGKMGYPRLPSGATAYATFFARVKENKPPVFDAPPVVGNERLLELLRSMTSLDAAKRLKDVGVVVSTLDELIRGMGGTVRPDSAEAGNEPCTETLVTGLPTERTMATTPIDPALQSELAKERALRGGKRRAWAGAAILLLLIGIGGGAAYWRYMRPHAQQPVPQQGADARPSPQASGAANDVGLQNAEAERKAREEAARQQEASLDKAKAEADRAEQNRKQADAERQQAEQKRRQAEEERQQAEQRRKHEEEERKEAEAAAAAAAAEAKRMQEEMAKLKAETERLKKEAEEEKARMKKEAEEAAARVKKEAEAAAAAAAAEAKRVQEEKARLEAENARIEKEKARMKKEAEDAQKRSELERLAKQSNSKEQAERRAQARIDATNRFWTLVGQLEPVASRKKRLLDAESIYRVAYTSNLLETGESSMLSEVLFTRRNWIVGRIANDCPDPVEVAGRQIAPSASELFVLTNGLPQRWDARRSGFDNLPLTRQFDGQEVSLTDGDFVKSAVLVEIPELSGGIACLVGGEEKTGTLRLKPGDKVSYSYRRRGYSYRGQTSYVVTAAAGQKLPMPTNSDWEVQPVRVGVPRLMAGATCWIDGREVPGGGVVTNMPGRKMACLYRRKGYKDVQKSYEVILADYQELPPPTFGEWELLPVAVMVPNLPNGVTCWIDGKQVEGSLSRKPGERIVATYRKKGCSDVKRPYLVVLDERQSLPVPAAADWILLDVQVSVPDLPNGVTCWINDRQATGVLPRQPNQEITAVYRRDGYEDIQKTYMVTYDATQSLPAPADAEWKQLKSRVDVSKLVEQAEIYYSDESWAHVLRCFAEARGLGYKPSADDSEMIETAYANERTKIKTVRDRVVREMSIGKSPSYDLKTLDKEENQLHEWYGAIKR